MSDQQCPDCGYQAGDDYTASGERSELASLRAQVERLTGELEREGANNLLNANAVSMFARRAAAAESAFAAERMARFGDVLAWALEMNHLSWQLLDMHANHMDHPGGPRCACGLPSRHESGACARCYRLSMTEHRVHYLEEQLRLQGQELGDLRSLRPGETTNASFLVSYRELLERVRLLETAARQHVNQWRDDGKEG